MAAAPSPFIPSMVLTSTDWPDDLLAHSRNSIAAFREEGNCSWMRCLKRLEIESPYISQVRKQGGERTPNPDFSTGKPSRGLEAKQSSPVALLGYQKPAYVSDRVSDVSHLGLLPESLTLPFDLLSQQDLVDVSLKPRV